MNLLNVVCGLSFYFTCWFAGPLVWPKCVTCCTLARGSLPPHHTEMGTFAVVDQTLLGDYWKKQAGKVSVSEKKAKVLVWVIPRPACRTHWSRSSCRWSLVCTSRRKRLFRLHTHLHFGREMGYTGHHLHISMKHKHTGLEVLWIRVTRELVCRLSYRRSRPRIPSERETHFIIVGEWIICVHVCVFVCVQPTVFSSFSNHSLASSIVHVSSLHSRSRLAL